VAEVVGCRRRCSPGSSTSNIADEGGQLIAADDEGLASGFYDFAGDGVQIVDLQDAGRSRRRSGAEREVAVGALAGDDEPICRDGVLPARLTSTATGVRGRAGRAGRTGGQFERMIPL
jgi:hypothetical protein